jgi:hypothetical protein
MFYWPLCASGVRGFGAITARVLRFREENDKCLSDVNYDVREAQREKALVALSILLLL